MVRQWLNQPRGLYILFFVELWERFSFYGMRALLVLYMTSQLMFSDSKAFGVYAAYLTLIYAAPIIGGIIGDRILGYRRSILFGAILISFGHISMLISGEKGLLLGLAFIISGTGFFKSNLMTLVGNLYDKTDPRRDSGFTLLYVAINFGGFLAPLLCGIVRASYGWQYGFALAGFGMIMGLCILLFSHKTFKNVDVDKETSDFKLWGIKLTDTIYIGAFISVPLFFMILVYTDAISYIAWGSSIALIILYGWVFKNSSQDERSGLIVIFVLMLFQIIFLALFEQAGSSLNLFAQRNLDRNLWGFWLVPPENFQVLNPTFVVILGPILSYIWTFLSRYNLDPLPPIKFGGGLLLIGLGFGLLVIGTHYASAQGLVHMIWLVLAYLFHSIGELMMIPIGYSIVTHLAPKKYTGMLVGIWFLSYSFAEHVAGILSKLTTIGADSGTAQEALTTLPVYMHFFENITFVAVGSGILLLLISPALKVYYKKATRNYITTQQT